jgi:tryptophan synthase alpha chain
MPLASSNRRDGRIAAAFRAARDARRRALVPFVTVGFPAPGETPAVLDALVTGGADLLELGIPFSDPIADGPTIQATYQKALECGITAAAALETVASFRRRSDLPIVLMTYLNPVLAYGEARFFRDARTAGVDGILVTDLPADERADFWDGAEASGLDRILLVAPTTPAERLGHVLSRASGFVYCLTRTGVTGRGKDFAQNLGEQVAAVRGHVDLPIAAGFGIRSEADVRSLPAALDGVVIGARLMEILMEAPDVARGCADLEAFLLSVGTALRRPS